MKRLPDWAFAQIERAYRAQREIRQQKAQERLDLDERVMRAHFADLIAVHRAGTCGGAEEGCCYVPCVPFMGWN